MKSILASILFLLLSVTQSHALLIDLIYEFDGNSNDGLTSFGTVNVEESSGDLNFEINANIANLGGNVNVDIHEFYFNLTFAATDLEVSNFYPTALNPPISSLEIPPTIAGSAGASFDVGINFGNGTPFYSQLSFTLSAFESLSIANLLESSSTNNTPSVLMAVHFQNADVFGAGSETVGGAAPVPEPATMLLFGTGLVGLVGSRIRRNKK